MIPIEAPVPVRFPPVATATLIALNCLAFLVEVSLGPERLEAFLYRYALVPALELREGEFLPLLSNTFLHGGWFHLIVNMWTLWIFGPAVEDRFGKLRYTLFYLACGVLASATHVLFNASSMVPALGASGAIAGVIGCYARLFPHARLVVAVPVLFLPLFYDIPAFAFAGFWFAMQLLQGTLSLFTQALGGGIAWWAHIGGFVAGWALAPPLRLSPRAYRPYGADEGTLGFTPSGNR